MSEKKKIAKYITDIMQNRELQNSEEFDKWISENSEAENVLNELSDEDRFDEMFQNYHNKDKSKGADKLLKRIMVVKHRQRTRLITSLSAVAALIVISLFVVINIDNSDIKRQSDNITATKIDAGVKLVLESGKVINLSQAQDTIYNEDIELHKTGDNRVALSKSSDSEKESLVKLVVPDKNIFTINLHDGTVITLNAGSELIFPNKFASDKREVTIKGEAFFNVAKDNKRPFIVNATNKSIVVYGTQFNVKCYQDNKVETYLAEGSVGIKISDDNVQMIKPNQVITVSSDNKFIIKNVANGDKYRAWLNNYFIFESDSLSKVIYEFSRWYGVEISVQNETELDVLVSGSFNRDTDMETIIESLEMISGVKLKVKKSM